MHFNRVISIALLILTACAIRQDLDTPFVDPQNEPILDVGGGGPSGTKYCVPDSSGNFSEQPIQVTTSLSTSDGSATAIGGGCVLRPIREVWAVFNNMTIMKWQAADSMTYTRTVNPTPDFTHLYALTYSKSTPIGEIQWTMQWYHGINGGTFVAPTGVNINYQRVSGTSNIPIWDGGVVLTTITDTVTGIAILNNFKARQSDGDNITSATQALNELITDARTGAPDWFGLNDGLKDDPSQPDPTPGVTPGTPSGIIYCVQDANGNYPAAPSITTSSSNGVSWVQYHGCINTAGATIYTALQDPVTNRWNNSASAMDTVTPASGSNPETIAASYVSNVDSSTWNMNWTYQATATAGTIPANYNVTFAIDPATTDYPVWNGTIVVTAVDTAVSDVEIDTLLLTNTVSDSPGTNNTITAGLFTTLGGVIPPAASRGVLRR